MYTIKLCIQIETCDRTETEACSHPHKLDFCIQSKGTQKANGYGYIPPITTFCFDERYHRDWNFHLVLYLSTYAVHWQATKSFFQPLDARQWQCNHTDTHKYHTSKSLSGLLGLGPHGVVAAHPLFEVMQQMLGQVVPDGLQPISVLHCSLHAQPVGRPSIHRVSAILKLYMIL